VDLPYANGGGNVDAIFSDTDQDDREITKISKVFVL